MIGFTTWIWVSTVIVLPVAEGNAEREHQTAQDTTLGRRNRSARGGRGWPTPRAPRTDGPSAEARSAIDCGHGSRRRHRIRRANEPALRRLGVQHAALFGSVARGEGHAASDLDVMIEIDRGIVRDVYDYVGVTRCIAELFAIPVDVVSRDVLRPYVRPSAERDAIHAF